MNAIMLCSYTKASLDNRPTISAATCAPLMLNGDKSCLLLSIHGESKSNPKYLGLC